ncbi:phosphatidylinositol phosphate synthase [Acrocarpospora catenulata]|uniref:phosphatidylinositol phosphate synthase n=1 Tax=Acrocarpospora catenulata TaxID=2836182 RepID=UPI001BDB3E4D|nr:CDP-alcohol phosphatidyltransferase family protein [Acrocarpospora catenulata]
MLNVLRPAIARVMTPLGRVLARHGVSPNVITAVGTLGTVAAALWFYPRGQLVWGTLVITFFVFADMLDGVLARLTGTGSTWGAFLDSTLDRLGDAGIFSGLIVYFILFDQFILAGVGLYCLVSGALVSYAKARAEGLGLTANVGIAERGERLLIALVAAFLDGLGVPYVLAVALWALAVASTITVIQRMVTVYRQAVTQ